MCFCIKNGETQYVEEKKLPSNNIKPTAKTNGIKKISKSFL
jgi:hypothetical protein